MSKTTDEAKLREKIKRLSAERDYWRSEAQKRLQELAVGRSRKRRSSEMHG